MQRILFVLFFFSTTYAAECGFNKLLNFHHSPTQAHLAYQHFGHNICVPEALYDRVLLKSTPNFRILYTLEGPHAIPAARADSLLDSLALWLEQAHFLHTDSLGMRTPLGSETSFHYQDQRYPEKYPVEIIDIGLMRDSDELLGGPCGACYGLTMPSKNNFRRSTLLIDNDFMYHTSHSPLDTWEYTQNGQIKQCQYRPSKQEITGSLQNQEINYAVEWIPALKVTTFHELYHACQLRYQNYEDQYHFWFEASATGVEAVAVPESEDYLQYLPGVFSQSEISILDINQPYRPYGQSVFYHSLFELLGPKFDHEIWSSLEKDPFDKIESHFDKVCDKLGVQNLANAVHFHAKSLAFSGARSQENPIEDWQINLHKWPEVNVQKQTSAQDHWQAFSFRYYDYTPENRSVLEQHSLTVSEILGKKDHFLVASSGAEEVRLNSEPAPPKNAVWPNPWRPFQGVFGHELCFINPDNKSKSIDIRDRSGKVIISLKRDDLNKAFSWNGRLPNQQTISPGLYLVQSSAQAKLLRFIVLR